MNIMLIQIYLSVDFESRSLTQDGMLWVIATTLRYFTLSERPKIQGIRTTRSAVAAPRGVSRWRRRQQSGASGRGRGGGARRYCACESHERSVSSVPAGERPPPPPPHPLPAISKSCSHTRTNTHIIQHFNNTQQDDYPITICKLSKAYELHIYIFCIANVINIGTSIYQYF